MFSFDDIPSQPPLTLPENFQEIQQTSTSGKQYTTIIPNKLYWVDNVISAEDCQVFFFYFHGSFTFTLLQGMD